MGLQLLPDALVYGLIAAYTFIFYTPIKELWVLWACKNKFCDPQISFQASPVLIHAEIAELFPCQKCRWTDRQMAQLYIPYSQFLMQVANFHFFCEAK